MESSINNNLNSQREWLKVSELEPGMQIAVPRAECFASFGSVLADDSLLSADEGDIMWDEIVEIKELGQEQVWDIEVEGTHNFVAGHLINKETGKQLSEDEEREWIKGQGTEGHGGMLSKTKSKSVAGWFGGIFAHNTYITASATIGTTTPGTYGFRLGSAASGKNAMIGNGALCVDNNDECGGALTAGSVYAVGAYSQTADYAEYFYSDDTDLESGELVCVDVAKNNAVKRCQNGADGNLMGIVSTAPAFTGNATDETRNNPNYKIIGMLGQLPTFVSAENGPIRPGDSLTSSATVPGYAMRAQAGDSTVGVALQALSSGTGKINVLVSRRNKSLTVAEVESAVVERIAAMEIEDEVAILVANAVSAYNFDPIVEEKITEEVDALEMSFGLSLEQKVAELTNLINKNKLSFIKEEDEKVSINTNLTITGALEATGGILVPLLYSGGGQGVVPSTTPSAFRVALDGTVTAYKDFVISDGITATSVKDSLAILGAEDMTKTNLTAKQDLIAGETFTVWGSQVAGAEAARPVFKVSSNGTVAVREDLVLRGYQYWKDIPGIVSIFAYNTADDLDAGEWVAGSRSASWYNEPIDAASDACDITLHDRCGARSFPSQAIIAATTGKVYIFNAQDGSLWKKISAQPEKGGISAIFAMDGALYIAQNNSVSIIDFSADKELVLDSELIYSSIITDLHAQRISQKPYLAVAGDAGIDFINLIDLTASHYAGEIKNARLTSAGDLYAGGGDSLYLFARAHNLDNLAPSAQYSATSTRGLYVSQDGNTAYTGSGSSVLAITASETRSFETNNAITNIAVDEDAQVIYAAVDGSVKALALGDGSILAEYQSGKDSMGRDWQISGAALVASLTLSGPTREGELMSDTLVIATKEGMLAQSADYSARSSLASALSGSGAMGLSSQLRVTNEAMFSGRLLVTDRQTKPLFAIDEETGNVSVREDIIFSSDAKMAPLSGVKKVLVYDTTVDSDGGEWRFLSSRAESTLAAEGSLSPFPQKAIIAAANEYIYIYDSKDKSLWLKLDIPSEYLSALSQEGIAGIAAKDGIIRIYGNIGLEFNLLDNAVSQFSDALYEPESAVISEEAQTAMDEIYSLVQNVSAIANNNLLVYGIDKDGETIAIEMSGTGEIIDSWSNNEAREDDLGIPYSAEEVLSASAVEDVIAIAVKAETGDEFIWMESRGFSLREKLESPKNVITVTDKVQTPRITSASKLSLSSQGPISFYTATSSAPILVVSGADEDDALAVSSKQNASISLSSAFGAGGIWRLGSDIVGGFGIFDKKAGKSRFVIDPKGNIGIGVDPSESRVSISGTATSTPVAAISQENAQATAAVLDLRQKAHSTPIITASSALPSGQENGKAEMYLAEAKDVEDDSTIKMYDKGTNEFGGILTVIARTRTGSATAFISFQAGENPTIAIISQGGDYEFDVLAGHVSGSTGEDNKATISVQKSGVVEIENRLGEKIDVTYQMMR